MNNLKEKIKNVRNKIMNNVAEWSKQYKQLYKRIEYDVDSFVNIPEKYNNKIIIDFDVIIENIITVEILKELKELDIRVDVHKRKIYDKIYFSIYLIQELKLTEKFKIICRNNKNLYYYINGELHTPMVFFYLMKDNANINNKVVKLINKLKDDEEKQKVIRELFSIED